jgi:hypothetical protein
VVIRQGGPVQHLSMPTRTPLSTTTPGMVGRAPVPPTTLGLVVLPRRTRFPLMVPTAPAFFMAFAMVAPLAVVVGFAITPVVLRRLGVFPWGRRLDQSASRPRFGLGGTRRTRISRRGRLDKVATAGLRFGASFGRMGRMASFGRHSRSANPTKNCDKEGNKAFHHGEPLGWEGPLGSRGGRATPPRCGPFKGSGRHTLSATFKT